MLCYVAIALFVAIMVLSPFSPMWGVILYLVHKILLPINGIEVGGVFLYGNYLALWIFLCFWLRYGADIRNWNFTIVVPYLLYFGWCALTSLAGWNVAESISYIRSDILATLLIPLTILNLAKYDNGSFQKIKSAFMLCMAIAIIYGVILIPCRGFNPYNLLLYEMSGKVPPVEWLMDGARLFGRVTSTFMHAMYYGAFLIFALVYLFFKVNIGANRMVRWLFVLGLISMVTCGVRSVIVAFMAVVLYYFFKKGRGLIFKFAGLALVLLIVLCFVVPELYDYLVSPFQFSGESLAGGSSVKMRLGQWMAAFDVIRDSLPFGNGYGWSTDYMVKVGNHPTLLAFESQVVKQLCETGVVGISVFALVHYLLFSMKFKCYKIELFGSMMVIAYLAYTILTGDYLYSVYFLIFLSFIYGEQYCGKHKCRNKLA